MRSLVICFIVSTSTILLKKKHVLWISLIFGISLHLGTVCEVFTFYGSQIFNRLDMDRQTWLATYCEFCYIVLVWIGTIKTRNSKCMTTHSKWGSKDSLQYVLKHSFFKFLPWSYTKDSVWNFKLCGEAIIIEIFKWIETFGIWML